jgi:hypothetical protein
VHLSINSSHPACHELLVLGQQEPDFVVSAHTETVLCVSVGGDCSCLQLHALLLLCAYVRLLVVVLQVAPFKHTEAALPPARSSVYIVSQLYSTLLVRM